jgi:hypothetical protein
MRTTYPNHYLLTPSFWKANRFSVKQEIPRILRNPIAHYRIHNSLPPAPLLSYALIWLLQHLPIMGPYVYVNKVNVHNFVCMRVNSNGSLQWRMNGSRRWHNIVVIVGYWKVWWRQRNPKAWGSYRVSCKSVSRFRISDRQTDDRQTDRQTDRLLFTFMEEN